MREGWQIRPLGEVCEIYNGGTPSTNIPEYWDGGIQWITPKDMGKSKDMYVSHCERTISQEGVEHSSTKVLPERSVIVSSRAPIGYVAINEVPMATNQGCKGFILGKEIYPEFLYYFLLSSTDLLNKLGTGATFKEVSGKKLAGIELPFPSIPEQQRIVDILDQEFAKIDALKANAEKSLQAAKDLFQATLKKELEPKEGWTQETLSAVCTEMFAGGDAPKNQMTDTPSKEYPIPIIANAVENEGLYGYTSIARVSVPSITIAGRGSGTGYVFRRRYSYFPIVRLIVIIPNDNKVCLDYLYFAIKSLNIQSSGSAIPQLTIPMIKNYLIAYPAKSIQEVIVKRLTQMEEGYFQLKENYQKTLTLCDDLKQSLLRKAFNGEL